MKHFLSPLLLLLPFFLFAQEPLPRVDAQQIQLELQDPNNNTAEARIRILSKVSPSDSLFCASRVTLSYYAMQLEKLEDALAYIEQGLEKACPENRSLLFQNKAAAQMRMENYTDAIRTTNAGIAEFPMNSSLWYNKALSESRAGRKEAGARSFEHALRLDPFYDETFLRMGNLAFEQKRTTQSLMLYNLYILFDPQREGIINALKSLNNLLASDNEAERDGSWSFSKESEALEEIDLILDSRISMNEDYDTGFPFTLALVQQNHAMLSQIGGVTKTEGVWGEVFVPFYQWIQESGQFEIFMYTLLASATQEDIAKRVKQKEDEMVRFLERAKTKWIELLKYKKQEWEGKNQTITYYFNDYLQALGVMTPTSEQRGYWEYFYETGAKSTEAYFDENGKRTGTWKWYHPTGEFKEQAVYENGVLKGPNSSYYKTGQLESKGQYVNDLDVGLRTTYNRWGALAQTENYKAGEFHGRTTLFHPLGEGYPRRTLDYDNGKVTGTIYNFNAKGDTLSIIPFDQGQRSGIEKSFHANGKLKSQITYRDGLINGEYLFYHFNGTPEIVAQGVNNMLVGEYKSYYPNGKLQYAYSMNDKGLIDGVYKAHDADGKLHYEFDYRNGIIIGYRYYDKQGKVHHEDRKKGGEFYYRGYSPEGVLITEGMYDIKGGSTGEWKYYSENGQLTGKANYVDDQRTGKNPEYYPNGQLARESEYVNGQLDGYYRSYYPSGQLEQEGWYREGEFQGEWKLYYADGTLESERFYHKGQAHGTQFFYGTQGELDYTNEYEYGEFLSMKAYNSRGEVYSTYTSPVGKEKNTREFQHPNGELAATTEQRYNIRHGLYEYRNTRGIVETQGRYVNDLQEGPWVYNFPNGTPSIKVNFLSGQQEGEYLSFHENGRIDVKRNFVGGVIHGKDYSYYDNGQMHVMTEMIYGMRHGEKRLYSPSGNLQMVRYYHYDRLIGYSYEDANGKIKPMIPIEKETADIKTYYANGQLAREYVTKNGWNEGEYRTYYEDGQLAESTGYLHGNYNGRNVEYYADGTLKLEINYTNDQKNGTEVAYYPNGNKKWEKVYVLDVLQGWASFYNETGKLTRKEFYFNDYVEKVEQD